MKFSIRTASRRHVTDRKRTREAARALHTELSEPGARVALGTRHSTPAPAPALPGRPGARAQAHRAARGGGGGQSLTRPRLDVCQNVDRGSSVPTRRRLCMNDPTSQGSLHRDAAGRRRGGARDRSARPSCRPQCGRARLWRPPQRESRRLCPEPGRGARRGHWAQGAGWGERRKVCGGAWAAGLAGQAPGGRPRRGLRRRLDPQVCGSREGSWTLKPRRGRPQTPRTAGEGTPAGWGTREEAGAKADRPGRRPHE